MIDRYSRQTLFKPIGREGQLKIADKHVLIIGCGALGSANAESLVRAGVGKVTIVDRDYVDLSNLQRQQLFTEQDVKEQLPKAIAAKHRLTEVNSQVNIDAHVMDATPESLIPILTGVDLIIDATDNFDIRFIINDLSHKYNIPWIYGSCVSSTGMSFTIIPHKSPCLHCLLDAIPVSGATCDSVGIISPTVQMVVAHQTTATLKILVENYDALRTKLVTFDLSNNNYQTINVQRAKRKDCKTCGFNASYPYLDYQAQTKTEVLCGRDTVQIRSNQNYPLEELASKFAKLGEVNQNSFLLSLNYKSYRLVFFRDGRTFVHGTNSIETAKTIFYQLVG